LGFALVGLLVWGVVQLVIQGPRVAWQRLKPALRAAFQIPKRMGRLLLVAPVSRAYHAGRSLIRTVKHGSRKLIGKTWKRFAGNIGLVLEIISGVLLGALLGAIYEGKTDIHVVGILFGALCCASVGSLLAASRKKRITAPA